MEIVDLVKGFPTHIWSHKSASIQPRTDWLKFEIHGLGYRGGAAPVSLAAAATGDGLTDPFELFVTF